MALWKKRSDPVHVAAVLASLADVCTEQCSREIVLLAKKVNPEIAGDEVAVNLAVTIYAVALARAAGEMGGYSRLAAVELAMQGYLAKKLEGVGAAKARELATVTFRDYTMAYFRSMAGSNYPEFGIGWFVASRASAAQPQSAAESLQAYRIVAPFLDAVSNFATTQKL